MTTVYFGWEASNLQGNGANQVFGPFPGGVVITSLQLDFSAAPWTAAAGFAEVLGYGFVLPHPPVFSPPSMQIDNLIGVDPDFGSGTVTGAPGVTVGNGGSQQGALFAFIAKGWMPSGLNRSIVMQYSEGVPVPMGGYVVIHMDHAGVGPLDCEIQGSFEI